MSNDTVTMRTYHAQAVSFTDKKDKVVMDTTNPANVTAFISIHRPLNYQITIYGKDGTGAKWALYPEDFPS